MSTLASSTTISSNAKRSIIAIVALRSFFCCLFIFLLNKSIDFGTSTYLLSLGAVLGIAIATLLAFTNLKTTGFFVIAFCSYLFVKISFFLINFLAFKKPGWFFTPLVYQQHISLALMFLFLSAFLAWIFWRVKHALTFEILILLSISIELLSGHRNFHFESPRILNNLAWTFGTQQLSVLVMAGAAIVLMLTSYVYVASLPYRPLASTKYKPIERNKGRIDYLANFSALTFAALLVYLICLQIFGHYEKEALSRTANGVGLESKKGVSPLDFHSALGSTNEPGALVRLESDYSGNPFNPMLYFRENALSQINGNEMVVSDGTYDQDVAGTTPSQPFHADEDTELKNRNSMAQSIYLLADHNLSFALDYPISITQLKNPNPKRFKASYRAVSLVPSFAIDSIKNSEVGDPRWSSETWQHYLAVHSDKRYAELAMKITSQDTSSPSQAFSAAKPTAAKAFEIVQYLSKHAIYTLTPNHTVNSGEDPVAPFLFGDLRGYCVHFAHATVYMLRSLGIPARIGTGYLTDLSQARDGHILLRMSDRHAWAEVYITDIGWVPFDTQPEQVESHADSQIDMKLLEELMGMIGPDEEILPSEIAKNEDNFQEQAKGFSLNPSYILMGIAALFSWFIIIKIYLRFGWVIAFSPQTKLKRSYISICSYLYDIGYRRMNGETRSEFCQRMRDLLGMKTFALTAMLNYKNYAKTPGVSLNEINRNRKSDFAALNNVLWWKKLASIFNPASIVATITGNKW